MLISREYAKQQIGKQEVMCKIKINTFKNWEAGSCMRNEKLIHSFKIKNKETTNPKMKTNTKKSTTIQIQRLAKIISTILIQRFGETSGKLQILSKKNIMKILRANFICHD